MGYYKILSTASCAIQQVLVCCFIYSGVYVHPKLLNYLSLPLTVFFSGMGSLQDPYQGTS